MKTRPVYSYDSATHEDKTCVQLW